MGSGVTPVKESKQSVDGVELDGLVHCSPHVTLQTLLLLFPSTEVGVGKRLESHQQVCTLHVRVGVVGAGGHDEEVEG